LVACFQWQGKLPDWLGGGLPIGLWCVRCVFAFLLLLLLRWRGLGCRGNAAQPLCKLFPEWLRGRVGGLVWRFGLDSRTLGWSGDMWPLATGSTACFVVFRHAAD
jgi:hypothetical protein